MAQPADVSAVVPSAAGGGEPILGSGAASLARVAGAAFVCVLLAFLVFEGLEDALSPDDRTVHALHYVRGLSASLLAALVVGLVTHRNERRRAAQLEAEVARRTGEAEEARAFLQVVVDTTPAALLVLDRDRRVVRANRTAETVHGVAPLGRTCHELDRRAPRALPDLRARREGGRPVVAAVPHRPAHRRDALGGEPPAAPARRAGGRAARRAGRDRAAEAPGAPPPPGEDGGVRASRGRGRPRDGQPALVHRGPAPAARPEGPPRRRRPRRGDGAAGGGPPRPDPPRARRLRAPPPRRGDPRFRAVGGRRRAAPAAPRPPDARGRRPGGVRPRDPAGLRDRGPPHAGGPRTCS